MNEEDFEYPQHLFECLAKLDPHFRFKELSEFLACFQCRTSFRGFTRQRPETDYMLTTYSGLVSIVKEGDAHLVIGFLHLSVKEYLMSVHLTKVRGIIACYFLFTTFVCSIVQRCVAQRSAPVKFTETDNIVVYEMHH